MKILDQTSARELPLQDRGEFVLERVAGKNVMSVGLGGQTSDTDYSFNLRTSPLANTFSAKVAAVAAATTFVDILQEAIDAYRPVIDADYYLADICDPSTWSDELAERAFDVIVLGEVIEHLPNPGEALVSLQRLLAEGGKILITVPNAFSLSTFGRMAGGDERVHPEHVAYYSPKTLDRLAQMSGLRVTEVGFYRTRRLEFSQFRSNPLGYLSGLVAERLPQYGSGVVVAVERPEGE